MLGLTLRYTSFGSFNVNYRYLTHAHSHVAMLGWVYLMLFTFVIFIFVEQHRKKYIRLFWVTQIAVLGMLLSFPFQGYGVVSISFSTLHILCSYVFAFWIWKDVNNSTDASTVMLKSALIFMLISTIGVWSLGPIIAIYGSGSTYYDIAIQGFLHFQFNGWFLFGALALLIKQLNIENNRLFKSFHLLLILSTIATVALPIHWFQPHMALIYSNGFGVVIQWVAVIMLLRLIYVKVKSSRSSWSYLGVLTYAFVFCSLLFKVLTQGVSLIPELAGELYQYRNFIVGYIHLAMLGVITGLLLASLLKNLQSQNRKIIQWGFYLFYFGFVTTEFIIFYQALGYYLKNQGMNHYHGFLFWASTFLASGILCILMGTFTSSFKD
ncbi:hypothetical protein AB9K26_03910 [Psychroserpens sp. XS_ASV72]|uniref:hypothetical protein n=1 Tax=Psychroserpens sp. XS_ASV72 TaxID=3241293 RepID=UPI00351196E0